MTKSVRSGKMNIGGACEKEWNRGGNVWQLFNSTKFPPHLFSHRIHPAQSSPHTTYPPPNPIATPQTLQPHRIAAQAPQQQHRQQQACARALSTQVCCVCRRPFRWVTLQAFGCVCEPKFGCDYAVDNTGYCVGHMSQICVCVCVASR